MALIDFHISSCCITTRNFCRWKNMLLSLISFLSLYIFCDGNYIVLCICYYHHHFMNWRLICHGIFPLLVVIGRVRQTEISKGSRKMNSGCRLSKNDQFDPKVIWQNLTASSSETGAAGEKTAFTDEKDELVNSFSFKILSILKQIFLKTWIFLSLKTKKSCHKFPFKIQSNNFYSVSRKTAIR